MKNAKDYRVTANEVNRRLSLEEMDKAVEWCDKELAPTIESESGLGHTYIKAKVPTGISKMKVKQHLESLGFSVYPYQHEDAFKIAW